VWLAITIGTALAWISAFVWQYAPLYTLYWPLPADTKQFELIGGFVFIIGVALIMVGTLGFIYNIYATIFARVGIHKDKTTKELLISGFGIDGMLNLWNKLRGKQPYSKRACTILLPCCSHLLEGTSLIHSLRWLLRFILGCLGNFPWYWEYSWNLFGMASRGTTSS